jgi:GT2 family glycosyltransferase
METNNNYRPLLSVLMANFNNGCFIKKAIESVRLQTLSEWELVIIDDASADDSVSSIKPFLSDFRIRFSQNKKNLGYIETLKILIALAKSPIIVILDSDDTLAEDALEKVILIYQSKSDYGLVYTQCYYCDENLHPVHLGFSAPIPEGKTNLHVNRVNAMRTFKKEAYLKTAGYDEKCLYAEDIDLTLKLEEVAKPYFIDKPLYYYRVLPKSQTHRFKNTRINRSSTALAKFNAHKRRLGTDIPNLDKYELSEMLFFGIINSILAIRFNLAAKFIKELFRRNPLFFFQPRFYVIFLRKIKKIILLKKEKPLLKI